MAGNGKIFPAATGALRAYRLRIEFHQVENVAGYIGAHRESKLLCHRRKERIIVCPGSARELLCERVSLVCWQSLFQDIVSRLLELCDRLATDIRRDQRLVIDLRDRLLLHAPAHYCSRRWS